MKISFMALEKKQTIVEMFLNSILFCLKENKELNRNINPFIFKQVLEGHATLKFILDE